MSRQQSSLTRPRQRYLSDMGHGAGVMERMLLKQSKSEGKVRVLYPEETIYILH